MTIPHADFSPSLALEPHNLGQALPLLVLGLPGIPGFNAFFYFQKLFPGQVIGMVPPNALKLLDLCEANQSPSAIPGLIPADPENPQDLADLFEKYRFRSVIDASGWCALKPCELNPEMGRRLNVEIGFNVMQECKKIGARLIRLSTDLVFDGNSYERDGKIQLGFYREDHPVSPVTMYGKLMAEAEEKILSHYPEAAILRIALPMGPSLNGHAGAIDWIESRFAKNRPATLYFDEVRSNLYVQDLNKVLVHLLSPDLFEQRGIFHIGGPRPGTLFQIAQSINKLGNYPPELLQGCLRAAAGPMPPRAGDVSMNTEKVQALIPANTLRPWPLHPDHISQGLNWHAEREGLFPDQAIAHELYGTDLKSWDHPLHLVPKV